VEGISTEAFGVTGFSSKGVGVQGRSSGPDGAGVVGLNTAGGTGVSGQSTSGTGVFGLTDSGTGVFGQSKSSAGVSGQSTSRTGVEGISADAFGVTGFSTKGIGVQGTGGQAGGHFRSSTGEGVYGESNQHNGVLGVSKSNSAAAVSAVNQGGGLGIFVRGNPALHCEGDIEVIGNHDIRLAGGDCAEEFDVVHSEDVEAGTVMIIGPDDALQPSVIEYDKRVVGVISGAGDYRPGIVLDSQRAGTGRKAIALMGKSYCKVDACYGAIEVGDLLTTSPTKGHAMRARGSSRAFGSVIGKALRPLRHGKGMLPILIALQ
jgi:hypothetical protein